MTALVRSEQSIAWELRGCWARGRSVRLLLSDRCCVNYLEGRIARVAVTGAYVVIRAHGVPWHVPCVDVLAVSRPEAA